MNRLLNLSVVLLMVSGKCSIIHTNISTMANSSDLLQIIILIRIPNKKIITLMLSINVVNRPPKGNTHYDSL